MCRKRRRQAFTRSRDCQLKERNAVVYIVEELPKVFGDGLQNQCSFALRFGFYPMPSVYVPLGRMRRLVTVRCIFKVSTERRNVLVEVLSQGQC